MGASLQLLLEGPDRNEYFSTRMLSMYSPWLACRSSLASCLDSKPGAKDVEGGLAPMPMAMPVDTALDMTRVSISSIWARYPAVN